MNYSLRAEFPSGNSCNQLSSKQVGPFQFGRRAGSPTANVGGMQPIIHMTGSQFEKMKIALTLLSIDDWLVKIRRQGVFVIPICSPSILDKIEVVHSVDNCTNGFFGIKFFKVKKVSMTESSSDMRDIASLIQPCVIFDRQFLLL